MEFVKNALILASGSPRRIEILKSNGFNPLILPAEIDEDLPKGLSPDRAVLFLALKKALHVSNLPEVIDCETYRFVLGADTVVAKDSILGKPRNKEEAESMLLALENGSHRVLTGVAICDLKTGIKICGLDSTTVWFTSYDKEDILSYINTSEPYDKAGAYAIQGHFSRYVKKIEGHRDNVVGLPYDLVNSMFSKLLSYDCL